MPLVRPEDMTPEQREQYDWFPSNLTQGVLLAQQRLAGALPSTATALRTLGLDPQLREGIILHVAELSSSPFEGMQHLDQAGKTGWTETEISAIEAGAPLTGHGGTQALRSPACFSICWSRRWSTRSSMNTRVRLGDVRPSMWTTWTGTGSGS